MSSAQDVLAADCACEAAVQNELVLAVLGQGTSVLGASLFSEQSLAIYRGNAKGNLLRAMAALFPAVQAVLGEADFAELAQRYGQAHPPACGDWGQYAVPTEFLDDATTFARWLAQVNPGEVCSALPFLPDLAQLDAACAQCQDAAHSPATLASLALLEQDPSTLHVVLQHSLQVLALDYPLLAYRQALLAGDSPAAPRCEPCTMLMQREGYRPSARVIDSASAAFVQCCMAGEHLAQAHRAALALNPDFDVSAWLSQAIAAQWLVQVAQVASHTENTIHPNQRQP